VVIEREKFIDYFHQNKCLYYSITPGPIYSWATPVRIENEQTGETHKIRILLAHDESTFKSGEIQSSRWVFPENAPLFSKGRGRGLMLSYFIVLHDNETFFELNDEEWRVAVKEYPQLLNPESKLTYYERSASGWLETGKDNYVDNEVILEQFERLFILLKFKKCFSHAAIEIIVDNARTHSAKQYDLMLINKFDSAKRCTYETIEWMDSENQSHVINCSYKDDDSDLLMSKGLFAIAKELNLIDKNTETRDKRYTLPKLRELLYYHPAFSNRSKLEVLGLKYDVKIIFCPKFHCECNPIEGFWCYLKQYVRKRNDQNFNTMKNLIIEAIESYKKIGLNMKLWKRFWKMVRSYKDGDSYQHILQSCFGAKSSRKVQYHKNNEHFNTLIDRE
jgi:hypothetical protein